MGQRKENGTIESEWDKGKEMWQKEGNGTKERK